MITPELPRESLELTPRQQWKLLIDERVKYAAEHGSMVDESSGGLCRIVVVSAAIWSLMIGIGVTLWITLR